MTVPHTSSFFPSDRVTVLAHRGLATGSPENSLAAFQAAIDAGADVIECDVRATKDGVAVFAHDETLERVFGNPARVRDLTYLDITRMAATAGLPEDHGVISVADALVRLPEARFNIDVKESLVIEPLAQAVVEMQALDRVLITSFSGHDQRLGGHCGRSRSGVFRWSDLARPTLESRCAHPADTGSGSGRQHQFPSHASQTSQGRIRCSILDNQRSGRGRAACRRRRRRPCDRPV